MSRRRLSVCLSMGLLLATGLAWYATQWAVVERPVMRLIPSECYAVDTRWNGSEFDLEFQPGSRYVLVVSSLGQPGRTHSVTLHAEAVSAVTLLPVRRIEPFRPRRLRSTRSPVSLLRAAGTAYRGKPVSRTSAHTVAAAKQAEIRDFHLHVTDGSLDDPKQYVRVRSRVVAEGRHVRVYLDRQSEPAPGLADEVVRLLDEEVIPALSRKLGETRDVDGDGKFAVLLTPWLGRLQGGRTSLGGFVRGGDFCSDLEPPFSNRCDMLYLNSNVQPGPHLRTLLTHEFTHAVCFSERLSSEPNRRGLSGREEEDWLSEAIAHVSEILDGCGWTNLHYRISRFLNAPQDYPLVVADYYRAGLWRNHGCRGATYLFLQWCVDQYGEELLRRLIRSPVCGTRNLQRVTGVPFEELYRWWTLALVQSGRRSSAATASTNLPSRGGPSRVGRISNPSDGPPLLQTKATPENPVNEPNGCYSSLDLQGPLAGWGLAGPRCERWNVDGGTRTIQLRGSATAFVEIESHGAPGGTARTEVRRIRLKADYGTRLQLSIVRRPQNWPRIRIETEWVGTNSGESAPMADENHTLTLRMRIIAAGNSPLQIETIACERNVGETQQSFCFNRDDLKWKQKSAGPARGGGVIRCYELPIPSPARAMGGLVVKVVASDASGRRSTAWANLGELPGKVQFAAASTAARR